MRHALESLASYFAVVLAFIASLPLTKILGGVLLIARLITDVPPAYAKFKEFIRGQ